MTLEIGIAYTILVGALVLFALEIFRIDFVAFTILAVILVLGPVLKVTPEEAISGFSNPATITVLAMFILSGGIYRTGMINMLAQWAIRFAGPGELRQLITVMLLVGPISAFINNTAAVAILIPLVIALSRRYGRAPSKLLMPLSFFSQLAGVITLIGTSTNILASALSDKEGFGPFSMFEFSKLGLLIFVTGAIYILLIGRKLLPERRSEEALLESYHVNEYLAEVVVLENSPLVGKTLIESRAGDLGIAVMEIISGQGRIEFPYAERVIRSGDVLLVRANSEELLRIKDKAGLVIEPQLRFGPKLSGDDSEKQEIGVWEVVVGPNSNLIGGTLKSTNFRRRFNCIVIAMQKHGRLIQKRLDKVRLGFGDTLLLWGPTIAEEQIKREPGFIITQEVEHVVFRKKKIPIALGIVFGVVATAALGVPILITSIVGCVAMRLTGCLKINEMHDAIRWDVILLLAGLIPLGIALENTGGAELLADLAARAAEFVPPVVVIGIFYLITMILTELISNNAAVVVMVPVAAATAHSLGLNPKALILAIMFAASTSFSTPVGYQTNTMIYGPGGYTFLDFLRVGGPLNLLLAIVTPIFIYLLWGA